MEKFQIEYPVDSWLSPSFCKREYSWVHFGNVHLRSKLIHFHVFMVEMIHFTGDIYENFDPLLLLPFCP